MTRYKQDTMQHRMIIAIDGPSASGKGTLAKRLAEKYGLLHLDTGATYRLAALRLVETAGNPENAAEALEAAQYAAQNFALPQLENPELRAGALGQVVSKLSAHADVRALMVELQRKIAENHPKGAVLDGRDIGTVVFPDAFIKFFVVASAGARAQRRTLELQNKGEPVTYSAVLADLEQRDLRDSTRATAPLRAAPDAIVLDTTDLTADDALQKAIAAVELKRQG